MIGGQWRSRLIAFEAGPGVRPTPDRVRQTVFDWLAPRIQGAVCLDLFAGSGAMGLEALSRGAARVRFVEHGHAQIECIRSNIRTLDCADRAEVVLSDALGHLSSAPDADFDVVFIDPPFSAQMHDTVLDALVPWLRDDSRVHVERRRGNVPDLPAGYAWERDKTAGQVSFGLLSFDRSGVPS